MIGFNAGLNTAIGMALFGPAVGVALGVINFLAAFNSVPGNRVYQGVLGWSTPDADACRSPPGLAWFCILIKSDDGVTWNGSWFGAHGAHIDSIHIHWETGTFIMKGGDTIGAFGGEAFDVGNFAFINSNSPDPSGDELHETGHALNVAAFEFILH